INSPPTGRVRGTLRRATATVRMPSRCSALSVSVTVVRSASLAGFATVAGGAGLAGAPPPPPPITSPRRAATSRRFLCTFPPDAAIQLRRCAGQLGGGLGRAQAGVQPLAHGLEDEQGRDLPGGVALLRATEVLVEGGEDLLAQQPLALTAGQIALVGVGH